MPFSVIFVASQVKDKSCGAIRRASILILAALGQILDNIESSATTGWEAVLFVKVGAVNRLQTVAARSNATFTSSGKVTLQAWRRKDAGA